jgi:hypothetical protein
MPQFEEIEVRSLGELLDKATPGEPEPASGRRRVYSVYRGTADTPESLLTALDRLGGTNPPHTKANLEPHILRNFIRYARPFLQHAPENDWELLIAAQHHGVPTRLLDWTYSLLVAAHFATLRNAPENCNRVVWRLDWRKIHEHFGLKPLAFLVSDLDEALKQNGYESVWDLFEKSDDKLFICMLDPPAIDTRIMTQNAAFTLASTKKQNFAQLLHERGLSSCLTRFVIPADKVDLIRDQLDLCGVDERRVFPDLDGVAEELRRYYSTGEKERAA